MQIGSQVWGTHIKIAPLSSSNATRRIFNSLFDVWKCGQKRSFVFDILLESIVLEDGFMGIFY